MVVDGVRGKYLSTATARRAGLAARGDLSKAARQRLSSQIERRLVRLLSRLEPRVIAVYRAHHAEVCINRATSILLSNRKKIVAPVIAGAHDMFWQEIRSRCFFKTNRYGIEEPRRNDRRSQPVPCAIVAPLSAFDAQCNRVGMGGGFYDRELEKLQRLQSVVYIGVAFDEQECESIAVQPWDEPMQFIVTPTRILNSRRRMRAQRRMLKSL